ncbi:MAG TPA: sensor domain-containing phosphodiesterase [Solimonas sp.]|nr:sensor domain-containing phosphodiesterase [Solimonas sp.]
MSAIREDVAAEQRVRTQQGALLQLLTTDRLDSRPLSEAFSRLTQKVTEVVGVERASIWKLDEAGGRLDCLDLYRSGAACHEVAAPLSADDYPGYFQVLTGSRAVAAHDARSDPATREFATGYLEPLGISSMLDAPVRRAGRTVGIVCLEHVGPMRRWSLDEQQFAASIADVVAMLLENQERRELQERVNHQARHDALTGLANLVQLRERLESIDPQQRPLHALLLIDLERFGDINHTLGHAVGDRILRAMAERLATGLPAGSLAARVSADKFALWLPLQDEDAGLLLAQEVRARLREPLAIDTLSLSINARIGVSLYPAHGGEIGELLRCADMAMCASKELLHGCQIHDLSRDRSSARRLALLHDLRGAMERGEMYVLYQPRVRLPDGSILGAEALLRWRHPRLGEISPAEFIPLAEMSDLIIGLTLAVLQRACAAWHAWQAAGYTLALSVNLSARALGDRIFTESVLRELAASAVPAQHVEFEITESALIHETEQTLDTVRLIRQSGARISLDDFGVGHSSMSRLSRMPVDVLKIDQMFVQHMLQDPRHAAIVQSSIQLGHSLGLSVVAEGVETAAQAAALAQLGCSEAQGYLFGASMPAEQLIARLRQQA